VGVGQCLGDGVVLGDYGVVAKLVGQRDLSGGCASVVAGVQQLDARLGGSADNPFV
jgi:hypothetical protein